MIEQVKRKSMVIRPSGRSSDFISPSFGHGCLYDCSYCYMKRNKPQGLSIATNTLEILTAIDHHAWFAEVEKPNQTHEKYVTYDISCNEDFALHAKYHEWGTIFEFFKNHPIAMGTLATKYVNNKLLDFNPEKKIRIRFSLMPEAYRQTLEPNTNTIYERLVAVHTFLDAGYEVHLNFSPVIVHEGWLEEYDRLFQVINYMATAFEWPKNSEIKSEVIFLTHSTSKHLDNVQNKTPGEFMLWKPEIQQQKTSSFGGVNLRYKNGLKDQYIKEWTKLYNSQLDWMPIRYIF